MIKYIQAREARQNFSKLINSVSVNGDSYTIKVRNKPVAKLVGVGLKNKINTSLVGKVTKTHTESFSESARKLLHQMYGENYNTEPTENLSENIDKIVYGI